MMTDGSPADGGPARPPVSVVVPFLGGGEEAERLIMRLALLRLRQNDEVIVVDNGGAGIVRAAAERLAAAGGGRASRAPADRIAVLEAVGEHSPYLPRNVGAERAKGEWLLFTDADCRPSAELLDAFFAEPVPSDVGALAGAIRPASGQRSLTVRWAVSRGLLDQRLNLSGPGPPAAATANLLVRRSAWEGVGGFLEGVREGADFEFCWRLQDAGWRLELRAGAEVEHFHREALGVLLRQSARDAAALQWLERRRPGARPRTRILRGLARSAAGTAGFSLGGRFERAAMKAIDGAVVCMQALGRLRSNAAVRDPAPAGIPGPGPAEGGLVVATDRFPEPSQAALGAELDALKDAGWKVRVEALARPARPLLGGARGIAVSYLEDEGALERLRALAWLLARHPLRSATDPLWRRRFSPSEREGLRSVASFARRLMAGREQQVRVHAAGPAATRALRAGRLLGVAVTLVPPMTDPA